MPEAATPLPPSVTGVTVPPAGTVHQSFRVPGRSAPLTAAFISWTVRSRLRPGRLFVMASSKFAKAQHYLQNSVTPSSLLQTVPRVSVRYVKWVPYHSYDKQAFWVGVEFKTKLKAAVL